MLERYAVAAIGQGALRSGKEHKMHILIVLGALMFVFWTAIVWVAT